MSENVKNERLVERCGELEWNGKYLYYTCEWYVADYLIGGDDPRLQGWETDVIDDSFLVTTCVDEDDNVIDMTDDLVDEIYWQAVVMGVA